MQRIKGRAQIPRATIPRPELRSDGRRITRASLQRGMLASIDGQADAQRLPAIVVNMERASGTQRRMFRRLCAREGIDPQGEDDGIVRCGGAPRNLAALCAWIDSEPYIHAELNIPTTVSPVATGTGDEEIVALRRRAAIRAITPRHHFGKAKALPNGGSTAWAE